MTPAPPAPAVEPRPADRAELVVRRIIEADDMPAFSRAMRELMASLGREQTSAQELANLVLRDYALTVKVVRAANSAHHNRSGRPVQSATHALMLLGARTVRDLAAGLMLFEHYRRRSPGLKELMLLSLLTASFARAAAESLGGADAETAHLCAMFRNLGEVLVAAHLPVEYTAVLRRVAEAGSADAGGLTARRTAAARAVLGCTFEDVGMHVGRHWGMPDVVRRALAAVGAPGEERAAALTAFGHALTEAVYRESSGRVAAATAVALDLHGPRLGISRAAARRLAEQAVADTRELFAAAGVRLDDLRLGRQLAGALAEAPADPRDPSDAEAGTATAAPLAGTPPAGVANVQDAAGPSIPELRARLGPELDQAASNAAAYDGAQVVLLALEALLRGGPFDRVAFHGLDRGSGALRPRAALGDGSAALLAADSVGCGDDAGQQTGAAVARGDEVYLSHGTRLTMGERQLLRRWDAVSALLVPVRVGGAVVGCVHADRRLSFAAPDAATLAYARDVAAALGRALAARRAGDSPAPVDARAHARVDASVQAKVDAVLRVLRGEPAEAVAAAGGVSVAELDAWRAEFLAGASARLAAA